MRRCFVPTLIVLTLSVCAFGTDSHSRTCHAHITMADGSPVPPGLKVQVFDGDRRISEAKVPLTGEVTLAGLIPGQYRMQTGGTGANFLTAGPLRVTEAGACEIAVSMAGRPENKSIVADEVDVEDLRISERARATFQRAFRDFEAGHLDRAKKSFLEVTTLAPRLSRTYNILGVISAQQGDSNGARRFFDTALELNPRSRTALLNRAKLSIVQRQFEEAVTLLERYRVGSRDIADVHAIEAEALLKMGKYLDAIREANAVHALPHDNWASVHVIAATAFEALLQPEKAVQEYQRYVAESTSEPMRERAAQRIRELTMTAERRNSSIPMNSLLPH